MTKLHKAVMLILLVAATSTAFGSDWTQFRGPNGSGYLSNLQHPRQWSASENVAWKTKLPGYGWSSPLIVGNKVFVTSAKDDGDGRPLKMSEGVKDPRSVPMMGDQTPPDIMLTFDLSCLDLATGEILWTQKVAEMKPRIPIHPTNTFATETPVVVGDRVVTYFGTVGLMTAFDLSGKQLWKREFDVPEVSNGLGTGSSLAAAEGLVFLYRAGEKSATIEAIDAADGKTSWTVDRPKGTAWSTPLVWQTDGKTELVCSGKGLIAGYDPKTGKELWHFDDFSSSFSASPAATSNILVFGTSGPMGAFPLYGIEPNRGGKLKEEGAGESDRFAWKTDKINLGMASPVIANSKVFVPGRGMVKVVDLKSGALLYVERLPKAKTLAASAWGDDENVFLLDEEGKCFVLGTGDQFELVGTNVIDDLFWSTPAVSGDSLLLRGVDYLYCIRSPQAKTP